MGRQGAINSPDRKSEPLHTLNTIGSACCSVTWIQTSLKPVTGAMTSVGSDACSVIAMPCVYVFEIGGLISLIVFALCTELYPI